MANAVKCLKPGSYYEQIEFPLQTFSDDNTMAADNGLKVWNEHMASALIKMGRRTPTGPELKQRLVDAGLVDVQLISYKQPLGPWPRDPSLKQAGTLVCPFALEIYILVCKKD